MLKRILGALAISAIAANGPAMAQDSAAPAAAEAAAPSADEVLATVNGTPITAGDVAYAYTTLGEAVERVPPLQRNEMILSLLIDMQLMAGAADKAGMADSPEFAQRMTFVRTQALQEEFMRHLVEENVTEEAVAARYADEAGKLAPREQISASHILVEDEDKAKELITEIDGGADFAELAKENSKDPGSAANGGSLGFFSKGQMVPEFEAAAFALEPGQVTQEPVKSQFGWHIIRLDEKRELPVPPLEQVADQIRQVMIREAYVAEIEKLKETASIERPTEVGAAEGQTEAPADGQTPAQ